MDRTECFRRHKCEARSGRMGEKAWAGSSQQGPGFFGAALEMGVAGEGSGPGDVAVTGRVEVIGGFTEEPATALISFSQSEIIGGDVLFGFWEAFLGNGELVHESEPMSCFLPEKLTGVKRLAK